MTMRNTHSLYLAGTLASALALAACSSSSDNLDEFDIPNWAAIPTAAIADAFNAPASLAADDLAYQAALIYDVTLEGRAYDQIDRPVPTSPAVVECDDGGRVYYLGKPNQTITYPFFGEDGVVATVVNNYAYGCTTPDPDDASVTLQTISGFDTARFDVPCGDGTCDGAYDLYGDQFHGYPYRVRYRSMVDDTTTRTDRVEIDGLHFAGPADPVDIGGNSFETRGVAQNLIIINAMATQVEGEAAEESVFAIRYGRTGNGDDIPPVRFVRRDVTGEPLFFLDGPLRSASSADESCLGGGIHLETTDALELNADNIVAGSITLTNGETETVGEDEVPLTATLMFEANGDVTVTDPDGMSNTFARGDLETLRQTCTQTVPVKRS